MSKQEKVIVWGKPQIVNVVQKSKSVWISSGEYSGEHLYARGRSLGQAILAWRRQAEYKGN